MEAVTGRVVGLAMTVGRAGAGASGAGTVVAAAAACSAAMAVSKAAMRVRKWRPSSAWAMEAARAVVGSFLLFF